MINKESLARPDLPEVEELLALSDEEIRGQCDYEFAQFYLHMRAEVRKHHPEGNTMGTLSDEEVALILLSAFSSGCTDYRSVEVEINNFYGRKYGNMDVANGGSLSVIPRKLQNWFQDVGIGI